MNKRDAEIRAWCEKRRPDVIVHLDAMERLEDQGDVRGQAMLLLLSIGFEAGRQFQIKNPELVEPSPMDY